MSKLDRLEKKRRLLAWKRLNKDFVKFQHPIVFIDKKDGKNELAGVMSSKYRMDRWILKKRNILDLEIYSVAHYSDLDYSAQEYSKNEAGLAKCVLDVIYYHSMYDHVGISLQGIEEAIWPKFSGEDGFDTDSYMVVKALKMLVSHGVVTRTVFNTFWEPNTFVLVMDTHKVPLHKVVKDA